MEKKELKELLLKMDRMTKVLEVMAGIRPAPEYLKKYYPWVKTVADFREEMINNDE